MILEFEILPYVEWLPQALWIFLRTALIVSGLALVVSFLVAAVRNGPIAAGDKTYRVLSGAANDLVRTSPRRIYAIARLAVQESIRRRVWVVFVVFAVILLFAGWFLDPTSGNPAKLYLSFVMWWSTVLLILLGLFLSAFSLPNEMKNKIIYTVVTKPVRSSEIVLGRMLGFTFVGTVLLIVMGLFSYMFVTRSLRHTHEITAEDVERLEKSQSESELKDTAARRVTAQTTTEQEHKHEFGLYPGESGWTEFDKAQGHRHSIISEKRGDKWVYTIGPREDLDVARVPVLGEMEMVDRDGNRGDRKKGVSVGQEWGYRRFVEGNSPAAAVWTFTKVNEQRFPNNGLLLERTIRVFRTHKGNMSRGVRGNIYFRNPETNVRSTPIEFTAKEFVVDSQWVDRNLETVVTEGSGKGLRREIDLFKDMVSKEGNLEVWIQCTDAGQYFGAAKPDLYLRADNAPFAWNLVKGYLGSWFMMVLIIAFGVMFSTFLSGPVAFLATLFGIVVMGLFVNDFIVPLADSVIQGDSKIFQGGGPVESTIRTWGGQGVMTQLEDTMGTRVAKRVDRGLMYILRGLAELVPDLGRFNNIQFVDSGFDVPRDLLLQQAVTTLAFVVAAFFAGFLFLRTREVAK